MSEDGEKILKSFQQMRNIFKDISKLLQTIDDMMKQEGWLNNGNVVYAYSSQKINNPEYWIPSELFRFYTNTKYPHYFAFVSILLDNDIEDDLYIIEEPLITAGFFDYGEKRVDKLNRPYDWDYWFARWYGYMENRKDDGTIFTTTGKEWREKGETYTFESAKFFGLPLTSIKNPSDIKTRIITHLINQLKK